MHYELMCIGVYSSVAYCAASGCCERERSVKYAVIEGYFREVGRTSDDVARKLEVIMMVMMNA